MLRLCFAVIALFMLTCPHAVLATPPSQAPDAATAPDTEAAPPNASPDPKGVAQPAAATSPTTSPKTKPNILFILIDTTRVDHLGFGGYERNTSPNLDAIANRGTVFEQARSTGPATRFTVPPIIIGKHYTEIHRGEGHWPKIKPSEKFLHEYLNDAGYYTAAVHTIHYFKRYFGMSRGADHWDTSCLERPLDKADRWPKKKTRKCSWSRMTGDYVTDRALWHVDREDYASKKEPWFLWAYYSDPHYPYIWAKGVESFGTSRTGRYDREIAFSDKHIGRLLDGLKERGLMDNTIVFMTSDHGEALDKKHDHGHMLHSANLYDELTRVPLFFSGPGIKAQRIKTPVSVLDIMPTVMDFAGIEKPAFLRGKSLAGALRGEPLDRGPIFMEKHRGEDTPSKAMIDWPYKVTVRMRKDRTWKRYHRLKIYNLEEDPGERRRIQKSIDPAIKDRLVKTFDHWLHNVLTPAPGNPIN